MVKASTLPLDTDAEIQRGGLTCSRSHGKPGACGEPSRPPPVHSRSLLCPWTWGNEAERRGRSEREKAGRALGETAAVCALPGWPVWLWHLLGQLAEPGCPACCQPGCDRALPGFGKPTCFWQLHAQAQTRPPAPRNSFHSFPSLSPFKSYATFPAPSDTFCCPL